MTESYSTSAAENLLSRLNRISSTKSVYMIAGLLVLAWIIESMEIGVAGAIIPILKEQMGLSSSQVGLLAISSTLGIVIGLAPAGVLADRYGRKKILVAGVASSSFFILIAGAFPNFWWVVAMRFLAGLGEGAVFPLPYTMMSEYIKPGRRATSIGWINGLLTMSYFIPAAVGAWAVASFAPDVAWRVIFLVAGLPLIFSILLAWLLPESPRWLVSKGKISEAREVVEKLERESRIDPDDSFADPRIINALRTDAQARRTSIGMLFDSPYLSRSLISWSAYTGGLVLWYAMLVYAPTIFSDKGIALGSAILFTGIMLMIAGFGAILQGYLADSFGRKSIVLGYALLASVGIVGIGYAPPGILLVGAGLLAAVFGLGIYPVMKIYIAEQYPTYMRGLGTGSGEAVGRFFGGVLPPYFIPAILAAGGVKVVMWFVAAILLVMLLPMMIWGRETKGLSIEEAGSSGAIEEEESVSEIAPDRPARER